MRILNERWEGGPYTCDFCGLYDKYWVDEYFHDGEGNAFCCKRCHESWLVHLKFEDMKEANESNEHT
tara:strand:- start:188 stop:388 length:201 start_codon:yes stop_codon:yes gene_type:complete